MIEVKFLPDSTKFSQIIRDLTQTYQSKKTGGIRPTILSQSLPNLTLFLPDLTQDCVYMMMRAQSYPFLTQSYQSKETGGGMFFPNWTFLSTRPTYLGTLVSTAYYNKNKKLTIDLFLLYF